MSTKGIITNIFERKEGGRGICYRFKEVYL